MFEELNGHAGSYIEVTRGLRDTMVYSMAELDIMSTGYQLIVVEREHCHEGN